MPCKVCRVRTYKAKYRKSPKGRERARNWTKTPKGLAAAARNTARPSYRGVNKAAQVRWLAEHPHYYGEYSKKRRKLDPDFRIASLLRSRFKMALKKTTKTGSAISDLGCSIPQLREYLEANFQPGMAWTNHGSGPGAWQIDHVRPLCSFDLSNPVQVREACWFGNLQPLWYEDHLVKSVIDRTKKRSL